MSQFGAEGMARAGETVGAILGHYYPGAEIVRAYYVEGGTGHLALGTWHSPKSPITHHPSPITHHPSPITVSRLPSLTVGVAAGWRASV